jgi:CheY-like chemotaxis protein
MQPPDSSPGALRILVTDDRPDTAESLQILLSLWGHDVLVTHRGTATLAVVQEFQPQIVFLDFEMPDLNGGEVAKVLRQLPGFERLIIVAATGHDPDEPSFKPYRNLFDHHLRKPFKLGEIERLLVSSSIVPEPEASSGETGT